VRSQVFAFAVADYPCHVMNLHARRAIEATDSHPSCRLAFPSCGWNAITVRYPVICEAPSLVDYHTCILICMVAAPWRVALRHCGISCVMLFEATLDH
jgi:hypothetical protein